MFSAIRVMKISRNPLTIDARMFPFRWIMNESLRFAFLADAVLLLLLLLIENGLF